MKTEGLLYCWYESAIDTYTSVIEFRQPRHILFISWPVLIVSFDLQLGLRSDLVPSGF
jgi:hypothetical protein